jgi:hypothetical protein
MSKYCDQGKKDQHKNQESNIQQYTHSKVICLLMERNFHTPNMTNFGYHPIHYIHDTDY